VDALGMDAFQLSGETLDDPVVESDAAVAREGLAGDLEQGPAVRQAHQDSPTLNRANAFTVISPPASFDAALISSATVFDSSFTNGWPVRVRSATNFRIFPSTILARMFSGFLSAATC